MKIEFKDKVNFGSLNIGDFFMDEEGNLCLKIPTVLEDGNEWNAISFTDVTKGDSPLYYFPDSWKCRKCEGKIVIT